MIEDTIAKIESQLATSEHLSTERKAELLRLLEALKQEIAVLSRTDREGAQSIAKFAEVSTHEAIRTAQNPRLRELSVDGLRSSVEGFEQSHPRLVQVVNSISQTLANLGI
jgi:hypothetical protein